MSTRYEIGVKGMSCINCANKVKNGLQSIPGISDIVVNVVADKVSFVASEQRVLQAATEFFKSLNYIITYQKTHHLNTPENQRTLTISFPQEKRDEIEKMLSEHTNYHILFQSNSVDVNYDTNFARGEDIVKTFSERNIPYEIIVKELRAKKAAEVRELFTLRETVITFTLNIIITILVFALPPTLTGEQLAFPSSWGMFGLFPLSIILSSTFMIIVYGYKIIIVALRNLFHRSVNMFTLTALGIVSSYVLGIYFIIIHSIEYHRGTLVDRHMAIHEIAEMMQTAATILAAVIFGKYLEERSKKRINQEIEGLEPRMQDHLKAVELFVPKNKKFDTLSVRMIHPYLVEKDDFVRIKEGSLVPFDGVIVHGEIKILENVKYGRDTQETRKAGDVINSGSEVISGEAVIQVNQTLEKSVLFQLYSQIQESSTRILPEKHQSCILNKLIKYFIPMILVLALITLIIWIIIIKTGQFPERNLRPIYPIERAISVLVASCPCALGLAIPIVCAVSLNMALKRGILIKDSKFLFTANQMNCLLLDKTGTITGRFNLKNYEVFSNYDEPLLWEIVKAIEKEHITHPIASFLYQEAVTKLNELKAKSAFQATIPKESVKYFPAEGIVAKGLTVGGQKVDVHLGNHNLIVKAGFDLPVTASPSTDKNQLIQKIDGSPRGETLSSSNIWLYVAGKPGMRIEVEHTSSLRENVPALIQFFKKHNREVYIVTGDTKEAALEMGKQLGLQPEYVKYECEPATKSEFIAELQKVGKRVMMVGDGLNDLLAFQAANLSVAINYKSEKNISAANVILLYNDIAKLANLLLLSKWSVIFKNLSLFFACCYNVVLIPATMGVIFFISGYELPPSQACWAMAVSSLVVLIISNSLRLAPVEFRPAKYTPKREMSMKSNVVAHIPKDLERTVSNAKTEAGDMA